MKLLIFAYVILTSVPLSYAREKEGGQESFNKLKRQYDRASNIDLKTFQYHLRGKILNCSGRGKEDDYTTRKTYRFFEFENRIFDRVSKNEYYFDKTLELKKYKWNGKNISGSVKILKNKSVLLIDSDSGEEKYLKCNIDQASKDAAQEQILTNFITDRVVSFDVAKDKVAVILDERSRNFREMYRFDLTVLDKKFKPIKRIDLDDLSKKTSPDERNFYYSNAKIFAKNDKFTIVSKSSLKDGRNTGERTVQRLSSDFEKADLFVSKDKSLSTGNFDLNLNDSFTFFQNDASLNEIVVSSAGDDLGILTKTSVTGFESFELGAKLLDGYLFSFWCNQEARELHSCPDIGLNYRVVAMMSEKGEVIHIITENEGKLASPFKKIVWLKGLNDGGFLLAYSLRKSDNRDYITVVRHDSKGQYVNSWGVDAKNPQNRNILIIEDFERDMFRVHGNDLYFSEDSLLFRLSLQ